MTPLFCITGLKRSVTLIAHLEEDLALDDADIYAKLTPVFRNIFDDDSLELRPESTAYDVPGWDSLSNIRLVLAISKAFSVKFSASDVAKLANVGEFVTLVKKRTQT